MAGPRSLSCGLSCSREKGCVCFGYVSTKWNLRRSGRERRTEILSVCLAFAYSCVGRPTRMEKLKPREREREKEWREKRDEKARGEDKEEVDGVEEKYRGRRRVRNRNGETWRGGNVETVIPESGIKKNLVVWRKMWGGGDRGSWTEGRYRWMVKAEEGGRRLWEKVQCSHVSADNLSLLQTNPFFSVVGIYLEIYDRDLRGERGESSLPWVQSGIFFRHGNARVY